MSKKRKIAAGVCFSICNLLLVAMFLTAYSFKGKSWSSFDWITKHFWYGYYGFVIGAVVFAVIGIALLFKKFSMDWFARHPKITRVLIIIVIILLLLLIFKMCSYIFDGGSSNSGEKCGVCDGSGLVPKDGFGFSKCPYCKGSGIPPI